MLITGRQARAALLQADISDRRARTALACGLAGTAVETSVALLYDSDRVEDLGRRRVVTHVEIHDRCPDRVFVSRRPVSVAIDPGALREELSVIPGQISPWSALTIWCSHLKPDGTKFLATVAGFVVHGATIREAHGQDLVLDDPGEWFDGLLGAQLLTGKGRQWKFLR
jgi:hypothetical protein